MKYKYVTKKQPEKINLYRAIKRKAEKLDPKLKK